jgi:hypothetical protein
MAFLLDRFCMIDDADPHKALPIPSKPTKYGTPVSVDF